MKKYKNILLALELDEKSDNKIIDQAKEFAKTFDSKLTLIHAIEHLSNYGAAYGVSAGVDIEEELHKEATKVMNRIGEQLGIPSDRQIIESGPAKQVILEHAEKLGTDLILVGSHGKHGVRLLLGSTANAVLHGAKCDVLAVRVQE